jgi:hypothetical protein
LIVNDQAVAGSTQTMEPKRISLSEHRVAMLAKKSSAAARSRAASKNAQSAGENAGAGAVAAGADGDVAMDDDDDDLEPPHSESAAVPIAAVAGPKSASPTLSTAVDYEDSSDDGAEVKKEATSSPHDRTPPFDVSSGTEMSQPAYSPAYSSASGGEGGEIAETKQEQHHDRTGRGEEVVITNSTQEMEDRQEYLPWMPSLVQLQRWSGRHDSMRKYALFDCVPIQSDPYLVGIMPDLDSRKKFLVDCFFQHRFYGRRPRPDDRQVDALIQAWNQFLSNVKEKGVKAWLVQLRVARGKFEAHSETGGRMRVHRESRKANLPCFAWEHCPQCPEDAGFVSRDQYFDDSWESRIPESLREAIFDLARIYQRRAESGGQATGGPRHTTRRGQGHPQGGPRGSPSYQPMAGNLAIEPDNSFAYPADPDGSAGAPRSSAWPRSSQRAVGAAAEIYPSAGAQLGESRTARLDESSSRLHLDHARLRATVAELRADLMEHRQALSVLEAIQERTASELSTLTRDYKGLLGALERSGVQIPRKRPRNDGTGGGDQRRT